MKTNNQMDSCEFAKSADQTEVNQPYVPPKTFIEARLALLCSEILGLEKVSVQDNFFSLGGDSLCATQVITKICKNLQLELSPSIFFETPTIRTIAEKISLLLWENESNIRLE